MKKLQVYRFNLVEIMLAIVILALGMTSVFVLFPAGLNNHKTAMAENSVADLAELVISHIRADAEIRANATSIPVINASGSEPAFDWEVDTDDLWTVRNAGNGYYFIRQLTGDANDPYVDFAAVAKVYQDSDFEDELFIPFSSSQQEYFNTGINTSADAALDVRQLILNQVISPLVVEISYPADRAYADREKVYFRFEIYNEKYQLKN